MQKRVTTVFLEMTSRLELRPSKRPDDALSRTLSVARAEIPCPELNQFLYATVGSPWYWHTRRSWDYSRWQSYVSRPDLQTWVGYLRGTPAGYFELEKNAEDVEVAYFGLLPAFVGQGLGGPLLTAAVERAWDMGARRVWVHTCDLDHPGALANYMARGFRVYRTEQHDEYLPDSILEPWPGANRPIAQAPGEGLARQP